MAESKICVEAIVSHTPPEVMIFWRSQALFLHNWALYRYLFHVSMNHDACSSLTLEGTYFIAFLEKKIITIVCKNYLARKL